jgi:hypothetical protein
MMSDVSHFWGGSGDEVAAVNPDDLRAICALMRDLQPTTAGQRGGVMVDVSMYKNVCSPGADVSAVWYRASMLGLLEMLPQVSPQMFPESPLTPWTHNGELDDSVFQVAATFPMKNMGVGVVHHGLPFDVQEFLKQIGART